MTDRKIIDETHHAPNSTSFDEGVIKFDLAFNYAPSLGAEVIAELNAWRQILYRLGLTGCDPSRYQGLAYGNVSRRSVPIDGGGSKATFDCPHPSPLPEGEGVLRRFTSAVPYNSFIISGTQTGGKPCLSPDDYCLVLDFDLGKNRVRAGGPIEPSSEALTHGAVYSANPRINCVLHIHSPILWRNTAQLGIPQTDPSIAYGTPEMGLAVGRSATERNQGIISMGGHEDGLIAFAETVAQAGLLLVQCLADAEKLDSLNELRPE